MFACQSIAVLLVLMYIVEVYIAGEVVVAARHVLVVLRHLEVVVVVSSILLDLPKLEKNCQRRMAMDRLPMRFSDSAQTWPMVSVAEVVVCLPLMLCCQCCYYAQSQHLPMFSSGILV
jgi:hypothetical protein